MPSPCFKFKQFTVYHDRCAMKVGTDGVLLGAWTDVSEAKEILDVGTGTGLIALQIAQRNPDARLTAIEIDPQAAEQARENVVASPWRERIEVVCGDFLQLNAGNEHRFDLIVSNPPYFVDALKCPEKQRNTARHTDTLSYASLFRRAGRLLSPSGRVDVILPTEVEERAVSDAEASGFFPRRRMLLFTKPDRQARRVLLSFGRTRGECTQETLCIEHEHHCYTPEYIALTKDFYLNM